MPLKKSQDDKIYIPGLTEWLVKQEDNEKREEQDAMDALDFQRIPAFRILDFILAMDVADVSVNQWEYDFIQSNIDNQSRYSTKQRAAIEQMYYKYADRIDFSFPTQDDVPF